MTIKDTTFYNYREIYAKNSFYAIRKSDKRFHTYKEAVICSRLVRIFITSCFYILCSEDKERCLIIDEEAGEVEGVDRIKG